MVVMIIFNAMQTQAIEDGINPYAVEKMEYSDHLKAEMHEIGLFTDRKASLWPSVLLFPTSLLHSCIKINHLVTAKPSKITQKSHYIKIR